MKAMVLTQYGPQAQFELRDVATPQPAAGQVLVRVAATSVNTVDTMIGAMGKDLPLSPDLPAILGMDFAGTIEAVGDAVDGFKPGDEVYGCAGGLADLAGSQAEYIAADARLVAHKPASLSLRQAAAIPLVGITALEGLERANVHAGQRVLIHGGSGGVGHVAVQLAVQRGAEVYATGGNDEALAAIKAMGATPINYQTQGVAEYVEQYTDGAGFDVVYDTVGNTNLLKSFEATALNGQVVTTTTLLNLDLSTAHLRGLSLHVVFMLIPMLHNHQREVHQRILRDIARLTDEGHYKPLLDSSTFSVREVAQAHQHLVSGKAMGKIVLEGF
ncbi:zinc-dependent alcohol dehydrogenase family protein [Spongiibacter sp. KMU-166]|uniref:Zinc-dependent alcohol dehydrogenase family protein n=1 Tax=Spongiibacter thalassae TaxID=2721624 RepID=A0ABX1GJA0_9GAMM|nr:zinc-dependent alcohol dehydrogenase family protein [Spongiibacter thalassae]NKI18432.1 zinc-dependent alcohol dehydrogenase family protein [Spongiibacter thalassae]